jgi:hypothetical protein
VRNEKVIRFFLSLVASNLTASSGGLTMKSKVSFGRVAALLGLLGSFGLPSASAVFEFVEDFNSPDPYTSHYTGSVLIDFIKISGPGAEELAVEPEGKLATAWARIKASR